MAVRSLSAAMITAISAKEGYADVWLIEILGSGSTIRYCTAPTDVSANSVTYTGIGGVITLQTPPETADPSGQSCQVSFSGVNTDVIAEVLANEVRGRSCRIHFGQILLSTGVVVADPLLIFKGMMNSAWEVSEQPSTTGGRGSCTVSTTVVSDMARYIFKRSTMTNWKSLRNMQARSHLTRTLGANPITTTGSSTSVEFTDTVAPCRIGIGSQVTISGAAAVNGLTMNGTFEVVTVPTENSFTVTAGSAASGSGAGGGTDVVCTYGHDILGSNADYLFNTIPDLTGKPVFWDAKEQDHPRLATVVKALLGFVRMSPTKSSLPSKGTTFKFGLRLGAAIAGYFTGTGGWGKAFSWMGISQIGIGAYDGWRMNNQMKEQSTAARQQGVEVNSTASESALPILYGKNKVGLKIIDIRQKEVSTDNFKTLSVTGAICVASGGGNATAERGINAVEYVYFDEVLAIDGPIFPANDGTNNPNRTGMFVSQWWKGPLYTSWGLSYYLRYMMHNGSQTAVDFYLNNQYSAYDVPAGAWGTQTIGQGVAYATFWMYYATDAITDQPTAYPNALPNITMIADGNRVPNVTDLTSAQAYSINPAKCIYDFMTSKTYGMGIPGFDIDTASFETARAYCDESVTIVGASGTITTLGDRYTCNGTLNSGEAPLANLEKMLTSCNGRIVYENGKYSLKLRKVISAETFELDETNIVGDLNFRRAGIDETCNSINVEYVDHDQNFTPQTITWPYPDDANPYLVEDGGMLNEMSVELPFTNNEYMAILLAAQILLETRTDVTCILTAQREALKLTVGSVVKVTHSTPGWTEKLMWVEAIAINGDGTVQIALKEYAEATYTKPTFKTKVAKVANNLPGQYSTGSTELPSVGPL